MILFLEPIFTRALLLLKLRMPRVMGSSVDPERRLDFRLVIAGNTLSVWSQRMQFSFVFDEKLIPYNLVEPGKRLLRVTWLPSLAAKVDERPFLAFAGSGEAIRRIKFNLLQFFLDISRVWYECAKQAAELLANHNSYAIMQKLIRSTPRSLPWRMT